MAKKKPQANADEPDFEQSLEDLETIVRRLEQGGGALEEALDDYSVAITLLKSCHQRLEAAQRQVELLSGVDSQGNPITEPVREADASLAEKQQSRSQRRSAGGDASGPDASGAGRSDADGANGLF